MLQPSKTKYRKSFRGTLKWLATRGSTISFGNYALKATESGFITSRQLEAARKAIVRYMKKGGKLWIRIFPDKPYTKKALEVPMGWGKGSVEIYRAPIKAGRIIFELTGLPVDIARTAFLDASFKLPVKTKSIL